MASSVDAMVTRAILRSFGKKRNSVTVPVSVKASTSSSSLVDSGMLDK